MTMRGEKLLLWTCILACALSTGCAKAKPSKEITLERAWIVDTGLCEPETVILDPVKNDLIVSNICGFKANGDGYLSRISLTGSFIQEKWVTGLNAPAGMAIHGRKLAVTDLDRVQIIDMDSGDITDTWVHQSPGRAYNDLAVDQAGNFYVSDSAQNKIFKISDRQFTAYPDEQAEFKFANGLHVLDETLFVGGEKLWKIDMNSGDTVVVHLELASDIDGIESSPNGDLNITIVGGDIWHYSKTRPAEKWTAPRLSSTNHALLPQENLVIIPTGYDNTVLALKTPQMPKR